MPVLLAEGGRVTCVGRLASLTPDQFEDVVHAYGGEVAPAFSGPVRGVRLVVLGQEQLALGPDGTPPEYLRKLRLAKKREGWSYPVVLTEEQFLEGLGLREHLATVRRRYSTATVCEALNIGVERVRAWVKAGLIRPTDVQHGAWYFEFKQVATAKALCELARSGVSLDRIRKSLQQLSSWLPDAEESLRQLAVIDRNTLLVRLEDGELMAADGQLHLEFEISNLKSAHRYEHSETHGDPSTGLGHDEHAPLRIGPETLPTAPTPRSPGQWWEIGVEQHASGLFAEAIESYRQALLLGGPEAQVCFDLAKALADLGHRERAAERYTQVVELDPKRGDAWNNLGVVLTDIGDEGRACDCFRHALDLDAGDIRARYNLADLLDDLGRDKEANPHWQELARRDPHGQLGAYARKRLTT